MEKVIWYYSAAHWHLGDVMTGNIIFVSFLWFLLSTTYDSLHVYKLQFYIYIIIFITTINKSEFKVVLLFNQKGDSVAYW